MLNLIVISIWASQLLPDWRSNSLLVGADGGQQTVFASPQSAPIEEAMTMVAAPAPYRAVRDTVLSSSLDRLSPSEFGPSTLYPGPLFEFGSGFGYPGFGLFGLPTFGPSGPSFPPSFSFPGGGGFIPPPRPPVPPDPPTPPGPPPVPEPSSIVLCLLAVASLGAKACWNR